MSSPVVCVKMREKANYIIDILKRYTYNGFPVVEDVQGVINEDVIILNVK